MSRSRSLCLFGLLVIAPAFAGQAAYGQPESAMRLVGPGSLKLFYPVSETIKSVDVKAFLLDEHPVTNEAFAKFLSSHPRWQRDRVSRLLADERYLSHWSSATGPGEGVAPQRPVVFVSWFAAKAYCEAIGKRLPNEAEWELAALASATEKDGSKDPAWRAIILGWYAQTAATSLPGVATGKPNVWGIYDLHGVIWEWVFDFNSTMMSTDNREQDGSTQLRFCGSGAIDATDSEDYASFMRFAFRSSLSGAFALKTLGFRCAQNIGER